MVGGSKSLALHRIGFIFFLIFFSSKSGSKKSSGNDKEKEYTLGGPLNETEINAKYVFETEISDRGGYAEIYRGKECSLNHSRK